MISQSELDALLAMVDGEQADGDSAAKPVGGTEEGVQSTSSHTLERADTLSGELVDLFGSGLLVARGEVIVNYDNFGVCVTEIITAAERQQIQDAETDALVGRCCINRVPCPKGHGFDVKPYCEGMDWRRAQAIAYLQQSPLVA